MDPGERGPDVRRKWPEGVGCDEPLDVFVNLCFVGFICPLRHRGLVVFGRLTRTHAIPYVTTRVGGKDNAERLSRSRVTIPGPANLGP